MLCAVCVDPVNVTPAMVGCLMSCCPVLPSPCMQWSAFLGMPALCKSCIIQLAMVGVSSAGLAMTVLPVMSAAAIWPVKMANGKFHGLIVIKVPRPDKERVLVSPVGLLGNCGLSNSRMPSVA